MTQIRPSNWVATGITSMKTYWHSKLPRVWSSRNTLNVQAFSTLVSRLNVILRKQPPHNVTLARCTTSTRRQKHPQHQTTASTARHALRNALLHHNRVEAIRSVHGAREEWATAQTVGFLLLGMTAGLSEPFWGEANTAKGR